MPSRQFMKLVKLLPKSQTSIYIQLRTHHIPLNQHLYRIGKSNTLECPNCPGQEETVHHFMFVCPQYARERHIFANTLRHKATSISHILTEDEANRPLISYVNSTGRLKSTYGEIPIV